MPDSPTKKQKMTSQQEEKSELQEELDGLPPPVKYALMPAWGCDFEKEMGLDETLYHQIANWLGIQKQRGAAVGPLINSARLFVDAIRAANDSVTIEHFKKKEQQEQKSENKKE